LARSIAEQGLRGTLGARFIVPDDPATQPQKRISDAKPRAGCAYCAKNHHS
jgi:hypothetical protein